MDALALPVLAQRRDQIAVALSREVGDARGDAMPIQAMAGLALLFDQSLARGDIRARRRPGRALRRRVANAQAGGQRHGDRQESARKKLHRTASMAMGRPKFTALGSDRAPASSF